MYLYISFYECDIPKRNPNWKLYEESEYMDRPLKMCLFMLLYYCMLYTICGNIQFVLIILPVKPSAFYKMLLFTFLIWEYIHQSDIFIIVNLNFSLGLFLIWFEISKVKHKMFKWSYIVYRRNTFQAGISFQSDFKFLIIFFSIEVAKYQYFCIFVTLALEVLLWNQRQ